MPEPIIAPESLVARTTDLLGQAAHRFTHVCVIENPGMPYFSEEELSILNSYPDKVIVYMTYISASTYQALLRLLPHTRSIIVVDTCSETDHEVHGTGLQHIALACVDDKKLIFCFNRARSGANPLNKVLATARQVKKYSSRLQVHELSAPHIIAGSDDDKWGIVYQESGI